MGMLLLAMVLAAAITHAAEQSTARTRARWDEARRRAEERGAARERARQERLRSAKSRWHAAVSTGPRHLLWWVYAAGWVTTAAVAALSAGAVGAYSGAVSGGRSGYRVGLEAGRRGAHYREAWRQWRRETPRPRVELAKCRNCGYWVRAEQLDQTGACPDCTSPAESGAACGATGQCAACRARYPWTELRVIHTGRPLCRTCWHTPHVRSTVPRRCAWCARLTEPYELDQDGWCPDCAWWHDSGAADDSHGAGPTPGAGTPPPGSSQSSGGSRHANGEQQPHRIYVDAERADKHEEETEESKGITNTMAELMPANNTVAATGEGYSDTVQSLQSLAKLLTLAHEEVTNLGDVLTANSLDAETLNQINELADLLDTAAPMADRLHKHVEGRHGGVADAMAAAGGSGNVAEKGWYDQY
ncbi:hypothetical protein CDG81_01915 [Actinopolyspora erythraea]|uniref:Chemotaxis protein n=1 Tax=Actinopolyspora erythraea TaxID=414996 RepID=A0A099D2Q2_9ACTN|nr:hypothetical protein [Actinopolyspora erythraea]ASU77272.1 hypothetical protein CDG81_01915 [Actinopolyspora erythraea]KGI80241.1 hypothetical protein IL38_19070 [Actinopolyspora erythraea]